MKRLIVILSTLFIALVAIIAIPIINRQIQLSWAINQITAAGDPVCFADLRGNHTWDSANAAWHLDQCETQANALFNELRPTFDTDEPWDWRRGLTSVQQQTIEAAFADHADVLQAIDSAIQCQRFFNFDNDANSFAVFQQQLFDRTGSVRTIQRILDYRCRYLAAIDKPDAAAEVALKGLQLARLQEQNPTVVSNMMACACRINALDLLAKLVREDALDDETLRRLDAELARDDAMDGFLHALKTERAFGIELGRQMWVTDLVSGALRKPYLDYMQTQITLGTVSRFEETNLVMASQQMLVVVVEPAIKSCRELMNRQRAKLRCLRVLSALQRHPEVISIDETFDLSTIGLRDSEVTDPFSGKPLLIRRTGKTWSVFSVGSNEIDDGGVFDDDLDVGFE